MRAYALIVLAAVFLIVWLGSLAMAQPAPGERWGRPPAGHHVLGPGMCRHYSGRGWVYQRCAPRRHPHRPVEY